MSEYPKNPRNRVRRIREYAHYDEDTVHGVLDAGLIAHVGFQDAGQPVVIPMLYARRGRSLLLHGAGKARISRLLASGAPICASVALLDGIVAARSAFNSSLHYRSAVIFGSGRLLEGREEALAALETVSNHVFPGRWEELRAPTEQELAMTAVIEVSIEDASAKISADPPDDEESDYALPVWAGVVPIEATLQDPVPDTRVLPGVELSPSIRTLAGRRL